MAANTATQSTEDTIRQWVQRNVGIIQVNPDCRGTSSAELHRLFTRHLAAFSDAEDVAAVVITGARDMFLAGPGQDDAGGSPERFLAEFDAIFNMPKPTVAAINGSAAVGGLEIALACDMRVCSEDARFLVGFLDSAALSTPAFNLLLPQIVGPGWARIMAFSDRLVSAERAVRIGLVDEVTPGEWLLERAVAVASSLVAAGGRTVASRKRTMERRMAGALDLVAAATMTV